MTRNRLIIIIGDTVLLILSYICAYYIRFETLDPKQWELIKYTIVPIIVAKLIIFSFTGLHTGPWRYTGILDLVNIIKASALGFLVVMVGMLFSYYPIGFSRSVFLIDTINTIFLISFFRISIRIAYSKQLLHGVIKGAVGMSLRSGKIGTESRVLIYGANERGEMLLRSMLSAQESSFFHVVGFIDDDPDRDGIIIHGIKHIGTTKNLEELLNEQKISDVMIASKPEKEILQTIQSTCQAKKVSCRIVPPYFDLLQKRIEVSQLRNISIDDLLYRKAVEIDYTQVSEMIKAKKVMITGAAGSIGSQLCRQILEFGPSELVCVDMGENPLFNLEQDITHLSNGARVLFYCSNVTNREKMQILFSKHKPNLVFHAAAHKHVPLMESNVDEVMMNNIYGTKNVADMAHENGSEAFVFISTDKAVKPKNVMGWTKRMGEVYTQFLSRESKTKFISVRFGNVLGSNGSVVPLFSKMIENGGPVKITHKDATRYFMTIPEAVLLILQSTLIGDRGDIMILDMGEPVRIVKLAEEMIRLAGYTPGTDIGLEFTGLRPGEKLHETLINGREGMHATSNPKISKVKSNLNTGMDVRGLVDEIVDKCYKDPQDAYPLMKNGLAGMMDSSA